MSRGRLRGVRRWTLLLGALTAVGATVLTPIAVPAAGAAAAPSPSPTGTAKRVLPIDIELGRLQVAVTLPLTLDGVLGGTPSATATPPASTPPGTTPTSTAPTISASAYPPTLPKPTPSAAGSTRNAAQGGGNSGGSAAGSAAGTSASHEPASSEPRKHRSTTVSRPAPKKRPPGMIFVKGVVPSSGPTLFILLCLACAIGVAFVVKLSGGRRRL